MRPETYFSGPELSRGMKEPEYVFKANDLPLLIEKMKAEHDWKKSGLNSKVLSSRKDKQMVLTVLHEGSEIEAFQSNDSITFQVLEGQLKFRTRSRSAILGRGQLMTLHEKVKYNISTGQETVFLLTMLTGNLQPVNIVVS